MTAGEVSTPADSAQRRASRCAAVFTTVYVCGGLLVVPSAMVRWPEFAAVVAAWCVVATATTWLLSGQTREAPESWVLVPIAGVVFLLVAPWLPSLAALLDRE